MTHLLMSHTMNNLKDVPNVVYNPVVTAQEFIIHHYVTVFWKT